MGKVEKMLERETHEIKDNIESKILEESHRVKV